MVTTESEALEIPLRALLPSPRLVVRGSLNLGIVPVDGPLRRTLTLHNVGRKVAHVAVLPDRSIQGAKISFAHKSIEPGASEELEVTWTPQELGDFRSQIELRVSESSDPSHPPSTFVPVSAVVVQPGITILDGQGNAVRKADFGELYFGERKALRFEILNQNPTELMWESLLLSAKGEVAGEDLEGGAASQLPFKITPSDGAIEAFGRRTVEIEFKCVLCSAALRS